MAILTLSDASRGDHGVSTRWGWPALRFHLLEREHRLLVGAVGALVSISCPVENALLEIRPVHDVKQLIVD